MYGLSPLVHSLAWLCLTLVQSYDQLGKLGDVDANKDLNSEIELAQAYLRAFR